jgi:hypothetical protein
VGQAFKALPKEIATRDRHEEGVGLGRVDFMNRRGFVVIYQDAAGLSEFMKADNEDNGQALKSLAK